MKSISLKLLATLVLALPAFAAEKDGHGHEHTKKAAGPNNGRVITAVEPNLEFFVTKDRKVEITALTEDLKAGKLSGQVISVTAGDRNNPTKLELKEEGKLVSTNTLPEGNNFPVSVSIKADASAKAVYEKFNFNSAKCPDCDNPEYACICGH
jgi:hypothetical protein